jgi:hypothetical protein
MMMTMVGVGNLKTNHHFVKNIRSHASIGRDLPLAASSVYILPIDNLPTWR